MEKLIFFCYIVSCAPKTLHLIHNGGTNHDFILSKLIQKFC